MRRLGLGVQVRVEDSRSFRQAATILDWDEDMYLQPISESGIQRVAAKENWVHMVNFNMQLHGEFLFLSWKSAQKGLKLCATPRPRWVSTPGAD